MQARLLLPFTHGVDMRVIEQAVLFARGRDAILVPLALIHVPQKRGARLEHVQQSKDFLEAVKHKAARYDVPVERFEVFTTDIVQSINIIASEKQYKGILLFVSGKNAHLLHIDEMKRLMEITHCKLYVVHLPSGNGKRFTQPLLNHFSKWIPGARKPQNEPLEEKVITPLEAESIK